MNRVSRVARASVVVGLTLGYLGVVFQVWNGPFWSAGLGDWIDPYFINALMEWWSYSLVRLENPVSPPVFHPTPGTLGYSHGLILFVPFYVPLRWVLHPFQAYNLAILLVVATGTLSLYALLRRFFTLTFVEALVLTAFFAASPNVLDGGLNTWTQRASVYLVPPILLAGAAALTASGRRRAGLAFATGLLATLLFTQDFYSGQFTFMFAGCALLPLVATHVARAVDWRGSSYPRRAALLIGIVAALWSAGVGLTGGGTVRVLGTAIKSTDPVRPLILALIAFCAFAWGRSVPAPASIRSLPAGSIPLAAGMLVGGLIFLWIYLPIYVAFPGFGEEEFQRQLRDRDPALLGQPWQLIATYHGFATVRAFGLIAAAVTLAWWPAPVSAGLRGAAAFWLAVSVLVFLIPYRFGDFSVWADLIRPLPGFNAIRDPLRIIYQYELAVVLAVAFVLSRVGTARWRRPALILVAVVLMTLSPNRTVFEFNRPNRDFDRWVAAPIRVDPGCRAFYMAPAPAEYVARSPEPWTLYSNDAAFIALRLRVPTLHGVSAWTPVDWHVRQPDAPGFADAVRQWIDLHRLRGVCALDVARRTMAPDPAVQPP